MRKTVEFTTEEYYHIFNRGVDKREIFSDKYDVHRFVQGLKEFNNVESGNDILFISRKENRNCKHSGGRTATTAKVRCNESKKLVNIICYCLIFNHYHFILEQVSDGGVSEFMKRVGGGYSGYYNIKYKRSGSLFQGRFKSVHIESNEQLLDTSAYVNLNNEIHKKFEGDDSGFISSIPNRSSWREYTGNYEFGFCDKDIILNQFKNREEYKKFARETVSVIKKMRFGDDENKN